MVLYLRSFGIYVIENLVLKLTENCCLFVLGFLWLITRICCGTYSRVYLGKCARISHGESYA